MTCQESTKSVNNFEDCVKCTICTVYCPVTAVNPAYPGPKQAGPDGERYRLKAPVFYDEALKYCLNCKRCEVACPSNVRIGDIIQAARIRYSRKSPGLRDRMLADTDRMGALASAFSPVVNATLGLRPVKKMMHSLLGIDSRRRFPKYSGEKFTTWFKREAAAKQQAYRRKVAYFHGCYVQYNYPDLGRDLVRVMNAAGYGVNLLDRERCCGVAKIANRLIDAARRDAEINIESVRMASSRGCKVVTTGSTCTLTMRDEYPHLLGVGNADVRDDITLATRMLYDLVDSGEIRLAFRDDFHMRVAYHSSCHMERLGWSIYSIGMLRMIPGLELVTLEPNCCGMAGTYGFKAENYRYSQAIGEALFGSIRRASVEAVATDCETCKWQIEMSTGVPVFNPVSIIAEALDYEKTRRLNDN